MLNISQTNSYEFHIRDTLSLSHKSSRWQTEFVYLLSHSVQLTRSSLCLCSMRNFFDAASLYVFLLHKCLVIADKVINSKFYTKNLGLTVVCHTCKIYFRNGFSGSLFQYTHKIISISGDEWIGSSSGCASLLFIHTHTHFMLFSIQQTYRNTLDFSIWTNATPLLVVVWCLLENWTHLYACDNCNIETSPDSNEMRKMEWKGKEKRRVEWKIYLWSIRRQVQYPYFLEKYTCSWNDYINGSLYLGRRSFQFFFLICSEMLLFYG